MPNKPVRHTELDSAIKNSLSTNEPETKTEWRDIESLLPKKQNTVKGPLGEFDFSLNSVAAAASASTVTKLKSALLLAKKSSMAMYIAAGALTIGATTFLIYNSISKHGTSVPATHSVVGQPVVQEPEKEEVKSMPETGPGTSTATETKSGSDVTVPEQYKPQDLNTANTITENPKSTEPSLVKTTAPVQYEKAASADEPVQLKTEDSTRKNEVFSSDTTEAAPGDGFEHYHEKAGVKKGKVLYYKESLSLDKLEQQITPEKKDSIAPKK